MPSIVVNHINNKHILDAHYSLKSYTYGTDIAFVEHIAGMIPANQRK